VIFKNCKIARKSQESKRFPLFCIDFHDTVTGGDNFCTLVDNN